MEQETYRFLAINSMMNHSCITTNVQDFCRWQIQVPIPMEASSLSRILPPRNSTGNIRSLAKSCAAWTYFKSWRRAMPNQAQAAYHRRPAPGLRHCGCQRSRWQTALGCRHLTAPGSQDYPTGWTVRSVQVQESDHEASHILDQRFCRIAK